MDSTKRPGAQGVETSPFWRGEERACQAESGTSPSSLCLWNRQGGKAPHYLNANVFNGLHGRSLPVATGAKLANLDLVVIAESGDGCMYGEGGNHFLAAIRRNIDITLLAHNNQVYGSQKGKPVPPLTRGSSRKPSPRGCHVALQSYSCCGDNESGLRSQKLFRKPRTPW